MAFCTTDQMYHPPGELGVSPAIYVRSSALLPAFQVQSVGHASSVDFSFGGRGPCDVDQQHIGCGIGMSRSVGPGTKDAHMHVYSTHST